jgi:hypothetical protein
MEAKPEWLKIGVNVLAQADRCGKFTSPKAN